MTFLANSPRLIPTPPPTPISLLLLLLLLLTCFEWLLCRIQLYCDPDIGLEHTVDYHLLLQPYIY